MGNLLNNIRAKTRRHLGMFFAMLMVCSTILATCISSGVVVAGTATTTTESLMQTAGVERITAARATDTRLGQLSNINNKFTFKVTHPGATITGDTKIGLFNTGNNHIWQDGYNLVLSTRSAEVVAFSLRQGSNNDNLLANAGDINIGAGDYITIETWIENDVFYVSANGTTVIEYNNAGKTIATGVYMGVYNEWSAAMEFVNVEIQESDATTTTESLMQTAGVEQITAARATDTRLGQLSNINNKFTFKVTHPGATITGDTKIGLFNTGNNHIWQDGYNLVLSARSAEVVAFSLRQGSNNDNLLANAGDINIGAGDYITIETWIENDVFYVSANGTTVIEYNNAGKTIATGVYMGVYNEWSTEMEFLNVSVGGEEPEPEPEPEVPTVPTDITFEDMKQTTGLDTVTAATSGYANLKAVSGADKGFSFKLNVPATTTTGDLKIGLFNTSEQNPWANGYILTVSPRAEAGTLGFALRKGDGEALLSYPGDVTGITGTEMTIQTWIADNTIYVGLNGVVILSYENDGSVTTGTYMSAYNGWTEEAEFTTTIAEGPEPEPEPEVPTVPTDITFEDLGQMLEVNAVNVSSNTLKNLGQVSNANHGFAFKINVPDNATTGDIKIGLYNTVAENLWANGYILTISPRAEEGTLGFALRRGSDEGLLSYPGDTTGITGSELLVQAWIKDNTLYVGVNGVIVLSHENDGSVLTGTYMSVYNGWSEKAEIKTINQVVEPGPEQLPVIPSDIVFEDLGITAGLNAVTARQQGVVNLGKLSSQKVGFKFLITRPTSTTTGSIKIGLYNTGEGNPWTDGYLLIISARQMEGTTDFAVRKGSDETLIAYPGEITRLTGEDLTVYTWIDGDTFYVGLNGFIITSWKNDGSVKTGTYLSAYSEFSVNPVIKTITEVKEETLEDAPDVPSNIAFEDLGMTRKKNTVTAKAAAVYDLGQLSSQKVGFKFKLDIPKTDTSGKDMKIGLFNTSTMNPWTDGYLLIVSQRPDKGTLGFAVRKGIDETLIALPGDLTGFTGKDITISAWIENNVFYVAVNNKIIASWENDGSVKTGTYLSVYSEWNQDAVFKTIKEIDEEAANYVPDTSGDVVFQDLGETIELNSVTGASASVANLGQLDSVKNGFAFKVSVPSASDAGANIKIGLYNMDQKNPWTDGYLFIISVREEQGTLGFSLRKGKDEALLAFLDDWTGITDEYLDVQAWLTDTDAEGGAHTLHIKVNGKEIITYTNADGSVHVGTYLAAYNEGKSPIVFKAIKEIMEPSDLYLKKFGDPTAMKENSEVKDEANDSSQDTVKPSGKLVYILVGSGITTAALVALVVYLLVKRKKNKE